ncbi:scarecrow-like protein 14 [Phtheirospermum japonicum]|uniref:Scarecrow-like protein 14 n=1 Tax=Phtheirospermum japonicum TaxID=374723 RepID=A0A830DGA0_9LAMI|nr:scarecrow-like protein 14 [Phtheirospermum japonicum]
MLMEEEEDLETKPGTLHDCLALQATEKSLYDALNNNVDENSDDHFTKTCSSGSSSDTTYFFESDSNPMSPFWVVSNSSSTANNHFDSLNYEFLDHEDSEPSNEKATGDKERNERDGLREKKNRCREDDSDYAQERRSNKQLANTVGQTEPLEMLDSVLLSDHPMRTCGETEQRQSKKDDKYWKGGSNRGRPRGGGKKQGAQIKEVVDLSSLLMQCAQAVASFDSRTVMDLLLRIRQLSSPQGDASERLAHYFANALEARLDGTGTTSYAEFNHDKLSAVAILKAYKMFITVCPFKNMSHLLANKTIEKLATGANTLHIIDFGILYGYQWPCLIQALSERPGGPPKLRITGIDFPQPGFRPAVRVANTGRCLAKYCERFGVPFEYIAIAQNWDTIRVEDLKIEKNHELLVVNSLYRLHNMPEETETATVSPRDAVLNMIRSINPDMFIQGVINGTYNTPFFIARFREALFHFSSMFDMFEATVPREDGDRLLFEEQNFGKDVMNIIACEEAERIERPDTYKLWHVRNLKAGFRQLPFDPKTITYVRSKVKTDYHKDFSVDEDGQWVLHGWKGRVNRAISCWQPDHVSSS